MRGLDIFKGVSNVYRTCSVIDGLRATSSCNPDNQELQETALALGHSERRNKHLEAATRKTVHHLLFLTRNDLGRVMPGFICFQWRMRDLSRYYGLRREAKQESEEVMVEWVRRCEINFANFWKIG
jgi:hypothetical protein